MTKNIGLFDSVVAIYRLGFLRGVSISVLKGGPKGKIKPTYRLSCSRKPTIFFPFVFLTGADEQFFLSSSPNCGWMVSFFQL